MIDGNKKDTRTTSKAKMERFEKKINGLQPLAIAAKFSILHVDIVLVSLLLTFKGANKLNTFL